MSQAYKRARAHRPMPRHWGISCVDKASLIWPSEPTMARPLPWSTLQLVKIAHALDPPALPGRRSESTGNGKSLAASLAAGSAVSTLIEAVGQASSALNAPRFSSCKRWQIVIDITDRSSKEQQQRSLQADIFQHLRDGRSWVEPRGLPM